MIIIHRMNHPHYRSRLLERPLGLALRDHPVVVLVGGRQTGKTTLVKNLPQSKGRIFRSLDDLDSLEIARQNPEDLVASGRPMTIDEVQRAPDLLLAIKRCVDRKRRRGQFLLTGSANLLAMKDVADSLAGRAIYLRLGPFTHGESTGTPDAARWGQLVRARSASAAVSATQEGHPGSADWKKFVLRGGYPPAVLARTARERRSWWDGFMRTYLERDVREVGPVSSVLDYRRLMEFAVARLGSLLNQSKLGQDAGLSQSTTHRYLNLLEMTFQIHRLSAFASRPRKRLLKSPKLYWSDVGLAAHWLGITTPGQLAKSDAAGPLLENAVYLSLLAWAETQSPSPRVSYYRTTHGQEVDFVLEAGRRLIPIEVKAGTRVRSSQLDAIRTFLDDYPEAARFGVVLYDCKEPDFLARKIVGLPVSSFL